MTSAGSCANHHKCHPPFSGGLWLPVELEEDSHRPLQHLVGVHHDPRPTTSPDGTYQTRIGHCSVRQNDGQPDLHEARIGQCPGEVAVGNQLLPTHKTIPSGLLAMEIGGLSPLANLTSFFVAFAHLLHCLFEKDYNHPTPYAPQSSWWGASDASASDSGEAYVGGWISNQPN